METAGEQIIKEKIDGLTDFPDGYTPNLASKWEVLENGLKPKRRPLMLLWSNYVSIAATLLFIGGATLLLIKQTSHKPTAQSAIVVQPKRKVNVIKAPILSEPTKAKPIYAKSSHPKRVSAEQGLPQADTSKNNIMPHEQPLEPAVVVVETTPAKKPRRFEEIDFNNPVIGTSVPTQTYVESQKFRFRIGFGGGTKAVSSQSSQPAVSLSTAF